MNQSILFNDDINFNQQHQAWSFTGQFLGQCVIIYFHSPQLTRLSEISTCIKYDLEEAAELWLEKNEPDGQEIHIYLG